MSGGGATPDPRPDADRRADWAGRARRAFRERFAREAVGVVVVPGRINLIGEHTDYNGGPVLPFAVDRYLAFAFAPRTSGETSRLHSVHEAARASVRPGDPAEGWARYPAGVMTLLEERGARTVPMEAVLVGDLEPGAGLSSSAALAIATALAQGALGVDLPDPLGLARLGREVEHRFLGVPCGLMDPWAILHGRAGHAGLLDCARESAEFVDIESSGPAFEIVRPGRGHTLAAGNYARRREECEEAARRLGVTHLATIEDSEPAGLSARLQRRVRHVVSETSRVAGFVAAFARGDHADAGELLFRSHESLARDFEVTTPTLDARVAEYRRARDHGEGILGARMIGGGFGGAILVMRSHPFGSAGRVRAVGGPSLH